MGVVSSAGVECMSKINLTKIWNKSAVPIDGPEISPPAVNVFAIDTSGNQMQQRERNNIAAQDGAVNYGSHDGGRADTQSSKKDAEAQMMSDWLQLMSPSYQQAYHELMDVADNAIEYYDQFDLEYEQMKAELEEIKAADDKMTIHMSDGRRVYVDENGSYAYQDAYGNWNKLEDSAIAEAKAKHQILGDQAITKARKVRVDDYETKLDYTKAMKDQSRQQAVNLKQSSKNHGLSQDELKEGAEEIKKDQQEFKEMRQDLELQRRQIGQIVKPDHETQTDKLDASHANKMFRTEVNEQPDKQPSSTPPSIG